MPKPAALTIALSSLKEGDVLLEEPDLAYSDALLAHVGQTVVKQTFRKGGDYLVRFTKSPSVLIEHGTTLLVERQVPTDEEQDEIDAQRIQDEIDDTDRQYAGYVEKIKSVLDQYGPDSAMSNYLPDAVKTQTERRNWLRVRALVEDEGVSLVEAAAKVGHEIGLNLLVYPNGSRGRSSGVHEIVHQNEAEGDRRFLQTLARWPGVVRRSTVVESFQSKWGI